MEVMKDITLYGFVSLVASVLIVFRFPNLLVNKKGYLPKLIDKFFIYYRNKSRLRFYSAIHFLSLYFHNVPRPKLLGFFVVSVLFVTSFGIWILYNSLLGLLLSDLK